MSKRSLDDWSKYYSLELLRATNKEEKLSEIIDEINELTTQDDKAKLSNVEKGYILRGIKNNLEILERVQDFRPHGQYETRESFIQKGNLGRLRHATDNTQLFELLTAAEVKMNKEEKK